MITEFIKQFTEKEYDNIMNIRKKYFRVEPSLLKIRDKINDEPFSIGIPMGEERKKAFHPSVALLEMLAKDSDRKAVIDYKAEWLFVCGRDIFTKAVEKCSKKKGLVLVQNLKDENLGYGSLSNDKNIAIKNILDRGDFLRREK